MTQQELVTIALIDKQLAAYNARDIKAFAATYHDEVEISCFSGGLLYRGKAKLIEHYGAKFDSLTYLHATSLQRMVSGNYLVDHELAQSSELPSLAVTRSIKIIAAYEVEAGLIRRVTFMR